MSIVTHCFAFALVSKTIIHRWSFSALLHGPQMKGEMTDRALVQSIVFSLIHCLFLESWQMAAFNYRLICWKLWKLEKKKRQQHVVAKKFLTKICKNEEKNFCKFPPCKHRQRMANAQCAPQHFHNRNDILSFIQSTNESNRLNVFISATH